GGRKAASLQHALGGRHAAAAPRRLARAARGSAPVGRSEYPVPPRLSAGGSAVQSDGGGASERVVASGGNPRLCFAGPPAASVRGAGLARPSRRGPVSTGELECGPGAAVGAGPPD